MLLETERRCSIEEPRESDEVAHTASTVSLDYKESGRLGVPTLPWYYLAQCTSPAYGSHRSLFASPRLFRNAGQEEKSPPAVLELARSLCMESILNTY